LISPAFKFGTVHSIFKGFPYKNSANNCIEPDLTAWKSRLAWLYTGGKGISPSVLVGKGLDTILKTFILNLHCCDLKNTEHLSNSYLLKPNVINLLLSV
jgi:hypothetical protein